MCVKSLLMIVTIIRYNNKKQTSVVPTRVMQICVILKFALRPFTSTIGKEKSLIPFFNFIEKGAYSGQTYQKISIRIRSGRRLTNCHSHTFTPLGRFINRLRSNINMSPIILYEQKKNCSRSVVQFQATRQISHPLGQK